MEKKLLLHCLAIGRSLARYDGQIHQSEQTLLQDLMAGFEITEAELLEFSQGKKLNESLQEFKDQESKEFLTDVLSLIACADKKLEPEERVFLSKVFKQIGHTEKIDRLLGPGGEQEMIKIYNQLGELAYQLRQTSKSISFVAGEGNERMETSSCHVVFMDQQNELLLNKFGEAIAGRAQDGPKLVEICNFLLRSLQSRFRQEEDLMLKWQYPREESHKKEHAKYLGALQSLLEHYQQKANLAELYHGVIALRNWFIRHINRFDHRMGFYFKTLLLSQRQEKKILIHAQDPQSAAEIQDGLQQMGLQGCYLAHKEREVWLSLHELAVNLLVFQRSGSRFGDLELALRIRQQLPGLNILFLPGKDNVAHFKEEAWKLKLLGPKTQVARFPFRFGELAGRLHDSLYATVPKPVEI